MQKQLYESDRAICQEEARRKYNLIRFGDHVATREGYRVHKGLEALQYYLICEHHWLPAEVFALPDTHIAFLFAEEMSGWTVPEGALG